LSGYRGLADSRERKLSAIMASLVVIVLFTIAAGVCLGAFLTVSFAIRREDRAAPRSLQYDAPDSSTRAARTLVGLNGSRWD
jgi:MFS superfamily sulfate permease-like transporter